MNPIKGEVPLRLSDGRSLTIVADNAALVRAAQAYTGKTKIQKLMSDIQPLLDAKGAVVLDEDGEPEKDTLPATCALFFGTLDAFHPDFTLRDATNILMGDADKVAVALEAAIKLAYPESSGAEGNVPRKPKTAQASRGRTSGASGARSG